MKRLLQLLVCTLLLSPARAQSKPAYVLYDAKGKKATYQKLLNVLAKKDILLFGEFHNNPISHWLELEVTKDCKQFRNLVLGAEMFERDNQEPLTQYIQIQLTDKQLDSAARLWKNYATDYAPLVNFARDHNIPFVATNVPRKYASLVAKEGFSGLDSLSPDEKKWIAPLPIAYDANLPGYKNMSKMMPGHGGANLPKAQALKDATMAYSILQNFKPGALFIHYNGSYHSDNHEGILWYLRQARPELRYVTITTVSQKDISKLADENIGKADFIICVDEDMTTTY